MLLIDRTPSVYSFISQLSTSSSQLGHNICIYPESGISFLLIDVSVLLGLRVVLKRSNHRTLAQRSTILLLPSLWPAYFRHRLER